MRSWKWMFSYTVAASLGLGFALVVSFKFVRPARSQTPSTQAPSNGDLPPEFLNETSTPPPAAPAPATPPATAATPAPAPSATPSAASPEATTAPNPSPSPSPAPATPSENVGDAPAAPTESETVTAPSPRLGAEDYVYDPTGRRDPFRPYKTLLLGPPKAATSGAVNREVVPTDPLQRWDVERFKIIGILWEVHAPKAMLKDPDGKIYTVMKNTKIGRYNGYVAAIREGEVVVIETFDNEGQMQKQTKVLELGK